MAIQAFVMKKVFGDLFDVMVPSRLTRKMMPSLLGRMMQHFSAGNLPSTRSILKEYRRIGGMVGNVRGRAVVNEFRESLSAASGFMDQADYKKLRMDDTMISPFQEKTKYRYVVSHTRFDPDSGIDITSYTNLNSNRLLSVGELKDQIGAIRDEEDWTPGQWDPDAWKLDVVYKNPGPGVDITLPSQIEI